MRVSRQKAGENRNAVLEAAARLFRECGLDGVGVAEVTREAGLTHGGFYGQFPGGKEGLAAEAVVSAFKDTQAFWEGLATGAAPGSGGALAAIVGAYLSDGHRDDPGRGCPVPALAADAARRGGLVQAAFSAGVRNLIGILAQHAQANTEAGRQAEAARVLATLAGAVLIARAVNADDPDLAQLIVETTKTGTLPRGGREA